MNKLKKIVNKQPVFKCLSTSSLTPEKYRGALTSFIRNSSATYFDNSNILQTAPANTPRFNKSQGTLFESSDTNQLLQSNNLTTTWGQVNNPETTQNEAGIDGNISAWTITDSSTTTFSYIAQAINISNDSLTRTLSFYLKKTSGGSSPTFGVNCVVAGGTTIYTNFRINTDLGTFLLGAGVITSHDSSYWFVSVPISNNSTGNTTLSLNIYPAARSYGALVDSATALGSAVLTCLKLSNLAMASSYIQTTTAAAVRNADTPVSIKTIGNVDTAKGSLYFEFTPQLTAIAGFSGCSFGSYIDSSNSVAIRSNGATIEFVNKIASVEYIASIPLSFVNGTTYKGAVSFGGGLRIAVNGVVGTKNTNSQSLKFGPTFQWGADGNSLNQPFFCIKNEKIYPFAMSEQELARLTA